MPAHTARRFALAAGLALATSAHAARLSPTGAEASSTYPPEGTDSYEPSRVMDGKVSTSWVEGADGSGLGQWVRVDFGEAKTVQKVKIWGGLWYSADYWSRANRPKDIELRWSDGSVDAFTMANEMVAQEFSLPAARSSTSLEVRIRSVHNGTTWLDTGISEIQAFDASAGEEPMPREIVASSILPADGDGNYDPMNVVDGLSDTMWCEGTPGDGNGESLELRFAGEQRVSKLTLISGIGTSMRLWMAANRASSATLTFSDGSTEPVTIRPSVMPQELSFTERATSSVKLTVTGVTAGREYNDLCISEARFR